jgi:predicted DCC family thiol-disulfide oxidoreductase YuxK
MSRGNGTYAVLFDGECPMCRRAVDHLSRWDREGVLELKPVQDPGVEERFPEVAGRNLEESIHLVGPEGEVWTGAAAVEKLMSVLPGWRWLSRLFDIPLVRPLGERVYRWVARNRYRLTCRDHCREE